jgi:hypothetical protein
MSKNIKYLCIYLYNGISALSRFPYKYKKFILKNKSRNHEPTYWATGDMANCFTNMNHEVLMHILSKLIAENRYFYAYFIYLFLAILRSANVLQKLIQ